MDRTPSPERTRCWRRSAGRHANVGFALCALALASTAPGQTNPDATNPGRWVRMLELRPRLEEAMTQLWGIGEPAGAPLLRALDDPRPSVRAVVLRALHFVPVDAAGQARLRAVADTNAPEASLATSALVSQRFAGRTAVLLWNEHRIEWLGAKPGDEPTLIQGFGKSTNDAELLADGGLLGTQSNVVVEWDADGKERWRYQGVNACVDVDRLANGHTLFADRGAAGAFEIDANEQIVWQFNDPVAGQALTAVEVERMPSGNTLICHHLNAGNGGAVLEVDPAGKLVRTFECSGASDADAMADGRVVVLSRPAKKIVVFSAEGVELTSFEIGDDASEVDALPDGSFLVAMTGSIDRFRLDGTLVGRIRTSGNPCAIQVMAGGRVPTDDDNEPR